MPNKPPLKNLLIRAFLPLVILPLLLAALATQWHYLANAQAVERTMDQDLLQTGELRSRFIESDLHNALDWGATLARVWPERADRADTDRWLLGLVSQSSAMLRIEVVARDGRIRFSSDAATRGTTIADTPEWQSFQRTHAPTFSDLRFDPRGRRAVRMLVPTGTGESLALLYDTDQITYAFRNPAAKELKHSSFIVAKNGRLVTHSDEQILRRNPDMLGLPPVRRGLEGYAGTMRYRDPDSGAEFDASYFPLSLTGWVLVLTQPSARTIQLPISVLQRDNLLILATGILLAVIGTSVLSRRLARPVERFSEGLDQLAGELVTPAHAARLEAPESDFAEFERVQHSTRKLYEALADTIGRLQARTRELSFANQQLAAAAENLQRLDQLKADFINLIGHDLRIPLTAIVGYGELLQDSPALGPGEQGFVHELLSACQRMQRMLEELLDYARLESGRLPLQLVPLEACEIIRGIVEFFKPLAEQKGLSLETELPDELPAVRADPDRLVQILNNLLSNAIKYTPPGGRVVVRACGMPEEAWFEVCDSGIGLSEDDKRHLFERFHRSARPEVQREKGSGLGLALVKGVIEAHGGRLEVESQEGRGAIFRFSLPRADRAAEEGA